MFIYCRLFPIPALRRVGQRFFSEQGFKYGFTPPQALKNRKPRADNYESDRPFIDYKEVQVTAGQGGDGCLSFLRLPQNEWAGPDGGDGGNGGHVVFEASRNYKSLGHVRSLLHGKDGTNGRNNNKHGKNANHYVLHVPVGTVVRNEQLDIVGNLKKAGSYFLAARGGYGGKGNRFFLSNEERAPSCVEKGAVGEQLRLSLELQALADVGLIGFPNAGKSTLLRAVSRARPRVAASPFTTLNPHIGMVDYDDYIQVAVADIPGLIQGAHLNKGLGYSFLRHIERCSCLLYVIDLSGHKCWTQLSALKQELEHYQPGLSERPHAIVGNKIDIPWAKKNLELLKSNIDLPVFALSARNKDNIGPLLDHMRTLYNNNVRSDKSKGSEDEEDNDDDDVVVDNDDGYGSSGSSRGGGDGTHL